MRVKPARPGDYLKSSPSCRCRTLLDRELPAPGMGGGAAAGGLGSRGRDILDQAATGTTGVGEGLGFACSLLPVYLGRGLQQQSEVAVVAGASGDPHVMAVKSNGKLWALTDRGPQQVRSDQLASQVDEANWVRCSAGSGARGPRSMIGPEWTYSVSWNVPRRRSLRLPSNYMTSWAAGRR